jgi:hypothetical protein
MCAPQALIKTQATKQTPLSTPLPATCEGSEASEEEAAVPAALPTACEESSLCEITDSTPMEEATPIEEAAPVKKAKPAAAAASKHATPNVATTSAVPAATTPFTKKQQEAAKRAAKAAKTASKAAQAADPVETPADLIVSEVSWFAALHSTRSPCAAPTPALPHARWAGLAAWQLHPHTPRPNAHLLLRALQENAEAATELPSPAAVATCAETQTLDSDAPASAPLADPADQPSAAPLSHKEQKAAAAKARKLANRAARAANPATSLHEQPNVVAAMKVRLLLAALARMQLASLLGSAGRTTPALKAHTCPGALSIYPPTHLSPSRPGVAPQMLRRAPNTPAASAPGTLPTRPSNEQSKTQQDGREEQQAS